MTIRFRLPMLIPIFFLLCAAIHLWTSLVSILFWIALVVFSTAAFFMKFGAAQPGGILRFSAALVGAIGLFLIASFPFMFRVDSAWEFVVLMVFGVGFVWLPILLATLFSTFAVCCIVSQRRRSDVGMMSIKR